MVGTDTCTIATWHFHFDFPVPGRRKLGSYLAQPDGLCYPDLMSPHRCLALAALLGLAPGLCYSQNKPASQLITKSALEAIIGYKLENPQDQRVEDAWLPFRALPRI